METALTQLRAFVRYTISGGFLLLAVYIVQAPLPMSVSNLFASGGSGVAIATGVALSYLIGQPVARCSSGLIGKVYNWWQRRKHGQDPFKERIAHLIKGIDLSTQNPELQSFCEERGISSMSKQQLSNFLLVAKLTVWHSQSPLWNHLNEREQLIAVSRETWLPLSCAGLASLYYLYKNASLSIGLFITICLFLWVVFRQAYYRHHALHGEARDILLSYFIVTSRAQAKAPQKGEAKA